jgi:hypothetical protein
MTSHTSNPAGAKAAGLGNAYRWLGDCAPRNKASQVKAQEKRAARLRDDIARSLSARQHGARLHRCFEGGRPHWRLSDGTLITPEAADALVRDQHVVGAGDGLFDDASQTFVWRA